MNTPKIVIWDWNGTLADDAHVALMSVNDMLLKRNMPPITMEQYYQYIDTPISRFYEHLFDLSEVPMSVIAVEFAEGYARYFQGLHPGAKELLCHFSEAGIQQIILSSGHRDSIIADMERFGIRQYFSQVLGADDRLAAGKVQRGLHWLASQSVRPENMLFIGDTLHDYDTARIMGIPCILCAIGHQSREDLLTAGVPVVDQFSQLEALLKNSAKN